MCFSKPGIGTHFNPFLTNIFQVDIRVSKFSVSKTKMKTDPPNSSGKSKSTPVWVITVAVLSGILLKQF
jgi:hypothetical protein